MTTLGVFRDDFYNATAVLPQNQYNATAVAGALTLSAAVLSGATENYLAASGAAAAVNYTTDTAANIIANIQTTLAKSAAANGGTGQPPGVPNLVNVSFYFELINNAATFTVTLVGGTGVTLGTGAATVVTGGTRGWIVTVTSPTTVSMQTIGSGTA
jgi:hypothetical protein